MVGGMKGAAVVVEAFPVWVWYTDSDANTMNAHDHDQRGRPSFVGRRVKKGNSKSWSACPSLARLFALGELERITQGLSAALEERTSV